MQVLNFTNWSKQKYISYISHTDIRNFAIYRQHAMPGCVALKGTIFITLYFLFFLGGVKIVCCWHYLNDWFQITVSGFIHNYAKIKHSFFRSLSWKLTITHSLRDSATMEWVDEIIACSINVRWSHPIHPTLRKVSITENFMKILWNIMEYYEIIKLKKLWKFMKNA